MSYAIEVKVVLEVENLASALFEMAQYGPDDSGTFGVTGARILRVAERLVCRGCLGSGEQLGVIDGGLLVTRLPCQQCDGSGGGKAE